MEDFRLSTTTYSNSLNRLQEAQQEKKTLAEEQKAVSKETSEKKPVEIKPVETKAAEVKAKESETKKNDSKEPVQLSISAEGMKTLNDSKDGSVASKSKESANNIVSISRGSRMENFSFDIDDAKNDSDVKTASALNDSEDAKDSSRIKELIEEEKEAAEKRAELIKEMNASDEDKTTAEEKAEETKSDTEKPPVTSFAGMTSAQIQTLYQQGRISYQTYMSKTEAKDEARKEQIEEINDTQADIVGLDAIKNQLLNGMPDQIRAEIA